MADSRAVTDGGVVTEPQLPHRGSLPIDPDVDISVPDQRIELTRHTASVLAVIALGGMVGALARYQIGISWPTPAGGFPAATLVINLTGCLVIGVLLVAITERWTPHPLLRPLLGTGVLGGFTTFSTFAVDLRALIDSWQAATALAYLLATSIGAVAAAALGMALARRLLQPGRV